MDPSPRRIALPKTSCEASQAPSVVRKVSYGSTRAAREAEGNRSKSAARDLPAREKLALRAPWFSSTLGWPSPLRGVSCEPLDACESLPKEGSRQVALAGRSVNMGRAGPADLKQARTRRPPDHDSVSAPAVPIDDGQQNLVPRLGAVEVTWAHFATRQSPSGLDWISPELGQIVRHPSGGGLRANEKTFLSRTTETPTPRNGCRKARTKKRKHGQGQRKDDGERGEGHAAVGQGFECLRIPRGGMRGSIFRAL